MFEYFRDRKNHRIREIIDDMFFRGLKRKNFFLKKRIFQNNYGDFEVTVYFKSIRYILIVFDATYLYSNDRVELTKF